MHTILKMEDGLFVGLWLRGTLGYDSFNRQWRCPNLSSALHLVHFLNGGSASSVVGTDDGKAALTAFGDCEHVE